MLCISFFFVRGPRSQYVGVDPKAESKNSLDLKLYLVLLNSWKRSESLWQRGNWNRGKERLIPEVSLTEGQYGFGEQKLTCRLETVSSGENDDYASGWIAKWVKRGSEPSRDPEVSPVSCAAGKSNWGLRKREWRYKETQVPGKT